MNTLYSEVEIKSFRLLKRWDNPLLLNFALCNRRAATHQVHSSAKNVWSTPLGAGNRNITEQSVHTDTWLERTLTLTLTLTLGWY